MTNKTDFKRTLDSYQAQQGRFRIVDVPAMRYLMINGYGDPNTSPTFAQTLETLYPVAYKLKFASKRDLDRDCTREATDYHQTARRNSDGT